MKPLSEAEVGDILLVRSGVTNSNFLSIVERTTATQVVTKSGGKYNKRTGKQVGHKPTGAWVDFPDMAHIATDEEVLNLKRSVHIKNMRRRLSQIDWNTVSPENVKSMFDLAKKLDIKSKLKM